MLIGSIVTFLVLYVDDILFIGNDIPTLYILRIRIHSDRKNCLIGLIQGTYLDKIMKRFIIQNSNKGELPIRSTIMFNKTQSPSIDEEIAYMSQVPYA